MGLVKRQNVWRCDHCGREDVWGAGWCTKLILHKSHGGWDEELVACSDACAKAIDAAKADKVPNAKLDVAKCERCGVNAAEEPHACPYAHEIGGSTDDEYCTCCTACQHECAMDI